MSQKKGRRVPPPTPQEIRRRKVATVESTDERAWEEIEDSRMLDGHVIAAGTMRNSQSGEWHTWVSLYGNDITSWYVGNDEPTARAMVVAIKALFSNWRGTQDDLDSMDALLEVASEQSTNPRATLPDDQVREIIASIASMDAHKN